jgi:hypothetical protein
MAQIKIKRMLFKEKGSWVPVVQAYNPSYLGGWDQEDQGSMPAQASSSWDPHLQQ